MKLMLVINSGSSSIKYEMFDMNGPQVIVKGIVECIGEAGGKQSLEILAEDKKDSPNKVEGNELIADHRAGMKYILARLSETRLLDQPKSLSGIGHRVVHGGERFRQPTLLNDEVVAGIQSQAALAPLHTPANLAGITAAREACPDVPQVAVFDTAFHQTIPPHAYHYAVPYEYYTDFGVRRYGFHGTSHWFVAKAAAEYLGKPLEQLKLISLHLGNGASAAAIDGGRCVDTSMGMTPLEGLMMGTRSGDLDPAILPYLSKHNEMTLEQLDAMLNKQSGLKGICGVNDMREVLQRAHQGDDRAKLAVEMYAYRIKKYLGAYLAVLGGADAILFTAGIGENAPPIRALACQGLEGLGIEIDPIRNATNSRNLREIHSANSRIQVLVVPTDEELEIAKQTAECIESLNNG